MNSEPKLHLHHCAPYLELSALHDPRTVVLSILAPFDSFECGDVSSSRHECQSSQKGPDDVHSDAKHCASGLRMEEESQRRIGYNI